LKDQIELFSKQHPGDNISTTTMTLLKNAARTAAEGDLIRTGGKSFELIGSK